MAKFSVRKQADRSEGPLWIELSKALPSVPGRPNNLHPVITSGNFRHLQKIKPTSQLPSFLQLEK